MLSSHCLCKHINYLKIRGNVGKRDNPIVKSVPNKLTIHFSMFGVFMINWINHYLNGTSIISIKWSRMRLRKSKFIQKTLKPNNF